MDGMSIASLVVLRRGVSGALYPKSAQRGRESLLRASVRNSTLLF